MDEIFHIEMDDLDLAHMRISRHEDNFNKQRKTQRDLELYMEQKTLLGYVKICRVFNFDPLNSISLHLILILMSKNPDRAAVLQSFLQLLPEEQRSALHFDEDAWSQFNNNESDHLTSISDWVTLFKYIKLIKMSSEEMQNLTNDPRVQVFLNSMIAANTAQDPVNLEYVVKSMLSVTLMNIPAAKMFERFVMSHSNTRDVELRSLRTVNDFTDNCSHMPQEVQQNTFIVLLRHVCLTPDFVQDVADIIDTCAKEHEVRSQSTSKKFSIREHISKNINTSTVQYVHTFENWCSQQKFSVTTSINLQRMLYFMRAQVIQVPEHVFLKYFDPSFVGKFATGTIHQIDESVIIFVIKSLRVYHNNINSLLDFRTKCMLGLNTTIRAALTLPVVLQLYVSIWQHESIREHCWRSIIGVYNHTIASSCETFRQQHKYEYEGVLESMVQFLLT
jgi:hypothetical protein